ncbi:hypothetical protein [Jhaorihella thermophila]|uniref:Sulfotransferase family protein n=1 Tax=Jhaorihella thermophila TaxID=488547 RepID=A0A1H5Y6A7_9RHOB|nr:hypothetical protein [Jhaorihella thermophila]SEG19325.1 hypothetical protein SAMN05421751_1152 [Jhaorihella thermophila]
MARLFLHIGTHKTGTSYLQHLFHLNRDRLEQAGLHYPRIGSDSAHHALVEVWFEIPDLPPDRFREGGPDRLWEDLVQRHARGPGTVILSSEAFSRQGREPIDYADLARRLAPFEEVRVICTLRRQAELAQSVWLEVARKGRALTLRPYLNRAWTEGLCHGVSIDHERIYDRLLEGFSPDRIHLFDYEHVRRARGGLAQALLDLAGADLSVSDLRQPPPESANISPDPLGFYLASRIAGSAPPPAALVTAVTDILRTDPPRPTSLLSRAEYARFHSVYAPVNARLVDRVQPWQPGFTLSDTAPSGKLFYRDDVTEWKWLEIAARLYADPPRDETTIADRARRILRKGFGR